MTETGARRAQAVRDWGAFALGGAIMIHQAFIAASVSGALITAGLTLLLVPAAAGVDRGARDRVRRWLGEADERDPR